MSRQQEGFTMFALRAWLWLVPVGMLVASAVFAVVAAKDERWGLLAVMIVMGVFGLVLLVLHMWLMYRFGRSSGGER
jgi:hypothetical protein